MCHEYSVVWGLEMRLEIDRQTGGRRVGRGLSGAWGVSGGASRRAGTPTR